MALGAEGCGEQITKLSSPKFYRILGKGEICTVVFFLFGGLIVGLMKGFGKKGCDSRDWKIKCVLADHIGDSSFQFIPIPTHI